MHKQKLERKEQSHSFSRNERVKHLSLFFVVEILPIFTELVKWCKCSKERRATTVNQKMWRTIFTNITRLKISIFLIYN
jgi:hypothetical protein